MTTRTNTHPYELFVGADLAEVMTIVGFTR